MDAIARSHMKFYIAFLGMIAMPVPGDAAFLRGLGDLPNGSFYSEAYAVSADGSTVVGIGTSESGYQAFRWTAAGGMAGLGGINGSNRK
jgi:probable HAF family extracellular repeat protein